MHLMSPASFRQLCVSPRAAPTCTVVIATLSSRRHCRSPDLHVRAASQSEGPCTTSTTTSSPHIKAAAFTGTYAVIMGLALVIAPKTVFGLLFGSETVSSGWIRVGGILFTLIGWQYLGTAAADRKWVTSHSSLSFQSAWTSTISTAWPPTRAQGRGALGFYQATVGSRFALSAAFALLVAAGESPVGLLVLAGLNFLGAVAMHFALRRRGGGSAC